MNTKRKIEGFIAGYPACADAIALINEELRPSGEVSVLDMRDASVEVRAKSVGGRRVPAGFFPILSRARIAPFRTV
jgi:hypothetical protein